MFVKLLQNVFIMWTSIRFSNPLVRSVY